MKTITTRLILISFIVCVLFSLAACSSLPKVLKEEEISQPDTFLISETNDEELDGIMALVRASFVIALGDDDDVYVGYSEEDKTVYAVYYSSFSKYGVPGVDYDGVVSSVKGISSTIIENVDFGDYKLGIIVVDGSKYSSSLDVLFIIKNGKEVVNHTSW